LRVEVNDRIAQDDQGDQHDYNYCGDFESSVAKPIEHDTAPLSRPLRELSVLRTKVAESAIGPCPVGRSGRLGRQTILVGGAENKTQAALLRRHIHIRPIHRRCSDQGSGRIPDFICHLLHPKIGILP